MEAKTLLDRVAKLPYPPCCSAVRAVKALTGLDGTEYRYGGQPRPLREYLIDGDVIHTVRASLWPYKRYDDNTDGLKLVLDACNVKYAVGNDAPDDAIWGKYIKILTKIDK